MSGLPTGRRLRVAPLSVVPVPVAALVAALVGGSPLAGIAFGGAGAVAAQEPAPIEAGLRSPAGTYDDGVDVLHYDVEIALSDRSAEIWGRVRLRARAARAGVDEVRLDFTGLEVVSAGVVGRTGPVAQPVDGVLRLPVDAMAEGDEVELEVEYRGTPDDGLLIRDNVEGRFGAFVDNWPNRTRFWLPTKDHPSDKATVRFTIHAPAAWEVIANGRSIGQPIPAGAGDPAWPASSERRTWMYASDVPHPTYTIVVGATEMVVREVGLAACGLAPASPRPDGCVEVSTWLYPGSADNGSPSFDRAAEMVDFFAELVGPFPYEKLAHVQSSTRFGGMENSSAIFYSERALASGRNIEGTVSHETAHQWFGDSVTEADWGHLWLSEGFATYFGALFFEYADGVERFRGMVRDDFESVMSSPDTIRPVVDMDTPNLFDLLNDNSYEKGGAVLHMLRGIMGNDAFFAGIRTWYETWRDGAALSADFQRVMEAAHGEDLDWFFEPWLYAPGYPVVEWSVDTSSPAGLRLDLRQIQGDYAPRYRLPITVEFSGPGGTERREIVLGESEGSWFFEGLPEATEVTLDPDGWVLMRTVRRQGHP